MSINSSPASLFTSINTQPKQIKQLLTSIIGFVESVCTFVKFEPMQNPE